MEQPKVFIVQPMNGFSDDEILERRKKVTKELEELGYVVIDSFIKDDVPEDSVTTPIWYLGKSLIELSKCCLVYCLKGWDSQKGCVLEHLAASTYGLTIQYEV